MKQTIEQAAEEFASKGIWTDENSFIEGAQFMKEQLFEFIEWLGYHHLRLNEIWVHKYADQRDQNNWKTTEQLYQFWLNLNNIEYENN